MSCAMTRVPRGKCPVYVSINGNQSGVWVFDALDEFDRCRCNLFGFDRDVLVFRSHFCLSAAPPMKPYIGSRTLKRIDFTEEKK